MRWLRRRFEKRKPTKVFVVGMNKTGTTSMAAALRRLGYRVGRQEDAELLLDDWAAGDFRRILDHCRGADAFQDIPFSLDLTYRVVDEAFPGSKFVLTVRGSADEWFDSLTRFHTRIVGAHRLPTADDLKAFGYRAPGWTWRAQRCAFGIDETTLYQPEHYHARYEEHIRRVTDHFQGRPSDLLVLNVADADAMPRLCTFLGIANPPAEMPHLNRSAS